MELLDITPHFDALKSYSILGTVYSGFDIEMRNILNIIPSYIIKFGATGSLSIGNQQFSNNVELTDYEQEICFLLLLNWEFKQISNFMNEIRPCQNKRSSNTIIKKKTIFVKNLIYALQMLLNYRIFLYQ
jgi:hypothetical protein